MSSHLSSGQLSNEKLHFSLFVCFRAAEVLLFALFQGKRFLGHDL